MAYIENEGALYRGPSRSLPQEIWSVREGCFVPYAFADQIKPVDWGYEITEDEAKEMMIMDPRRIPSPEENPSIYGGYDGGKEVPEEQVLEMPKNAPPELQARAKEWAEQ